MVRFAIPNDRSRSLKLGQSLPVGWRLHVAIPNDRSRSLKLEHLEMPVGVDAVAIPNDRSRSLKLHQPRRLPGVLGLRYLTIVRDR